MYVEFNLDGKIEWKNWVLYYVIIFYGLNGFFILNYFLVIWNWFIDIKYYIWNGIDILFSCRKCNEIGVIWVSDGECWS